MSERQRYAWIWCLPILLFGSLATYAMTIKAGPLSALYFGPLTIVGALLCYLWFGRRRAAP